VKAIKAKVWEITFTHRESVVTSRYGTKEQALVRKQYVEWHGEKCSEPVLVEVEVGIPLYH
jgi:hypothetical protein